ncbi:methylenetetrahydrofolate reductase [Serpentinicella sp. ANB-PHB4]|uniref:methylenetetrahydrofolate reductase n=1 Tax=Serpentinicella sp. ANB-PHB4 TaxID=3074076 RepID=UPI002866315B|nr:methylenetetrahydrofolate reductase [Serpentinicella sp. ANB-PHB4]MDR5660064.1 methylenetetrahydrofolate reductase [Serpentinicella sp. ANB-PHB4]
MNHLKEKLRKRKFSITVELEPPKGVDTSKLLQAVNDLKGVVDAVNITDGPMANMRTSAIALAHHIKTETGVESIFHLTCRDRNTIALQSELLGASVLGANNLLVLTGDEPTRGDHPDATGVFQVDSVGLVNVVNTLNKGYDLAGNQLNAPTEFMIGVAANPCAENLEKEVEKLEKKVEKGVHFIQTQPVYDIKDLQKFTNCVEKLNVPVLCGILPLKSYKMAQSISKNVPGIKIPDSILKRMELGGQEEGIKIAGEFLKEARAYCNGVHIMPLGNTKLSLEILEYSE